ncbi:MAG: GIY-YIG nuclease family protein [Oscillospiraceae bacterium]|nr:GIY-YIG nuclease family protein [Oscillospiraceae bacterium]
MNENHYCVYMHRAPNGKVYVGMTGYRPSHRWGGGRAYHANKHFTNAILKYGWDNFEHEVIASDLTKQEAAELEKKLIKAFHATDPKYGYNKSTGGECPASGAKWTPEMKARASEAHKGVVISEEQKIKISQSKRGKPNGKQGKVGRECDHVGIVYQINEQTGEVVNVFYGFYEMERLTGYSKTPVREAAHGKRKRAYGYAWEYVKRRPR